MTGREDVGTPDPTAVLSVRSLTKSFGAVRALRGVSFDLHRGEILGLVGDNGAGKSTLVKCLCGNITPDAGTISLDGQQVQLESPAHALDLGIETVYQDLSLIPMADVATNMFLNREITRDWPLLGWLGLLDKRRMYDEAEAILERLSIRVPSVRMPVSTLSGGQRQAVAVGRAVAWGRHIVLMDEPAAALGVEQSRLVLDLIRRLSVDGISVIVVSHNMQEVVDVCDRVLVLRHGAKVADVEIAAVTSRDLVEYITGTSLGPGADIPAGAEI